MIETSLKIFDEVFIWAVRIGAIVWIGLMIVWAWLMFIKPLVRRLRARIKQSRLTH
jgi:hypothetical protein